MELVHQPHLDAKEFGLDRTTQDLDRGHCMWGGAGTEQDDWCGQKVQNPESGRYEPRKRHGVIDGILYGFTVPDNGPGSGGLRVEKYMQPLWICENHDELFLELHKDWQHTLMRFAVPSGTVYSLEEATEQMFEVSFRFYTKADTDTNHVSMRWTDVLNGVLEDTERVEYLKVVGT